MGKILPKRKYFKSSIYRPNLNVGSHIDNVKYSLEHLIFLNARESEHTILKKRIWVVIIVTLISMIVGSFLSPKGQAEVATFYPTACLGGWNNPHNAEGESQVRPGDDESAFGTENSAVLPKEMSADIYCGSFVGTIEQNTKPIKMVVSLSWGTRGLLATSSLVGSDIATSTSPTEGTSTADALLLAATGTENGIMLASSTDASSTLETSTTTEIVSVDNGTSSATSTPETTATSTPETISVLDKVLDVVQSAFDSVFGSNEAKSTGTDSAAQAATTTDSAPVITSSSTVGQQQESVISEPASTAPPQTQLDNTPLPNPVPDTIVAPSSDTTQTSEGPTSFLEDFLDRFASRLVTKVFAEEVIPSVNASTSESEISVANENATSSLGENFAEATSSENAATSSVEQATGTVATSSTEVVNTNTSSDFLEVLYTFDGVVWNSLGRVDETSIKYRTFEIPVTASTSWEDMGQLQIKVQTVDRIDTKPDTYLDAIKVEVLYETPLTHEHPDFLRDTILQDEVVGGIRVLRIINNDTNKEEIWYMHPEEATTTVEVATSTVVTSTTTEIATTTESDSSISSTSTLPEVLASSSTEVIASTTTSPSDRIIKPSMSKNKWMKLESDEVSAKGTETLLKEIEKQEKKAEFMIPDFAKDFIKKIQGRFLNAVIVQVEQEGKDGLWLFNVEDGTEEKIDSQGKTTFSKTYPFGMKGDNVFWLSEDGAIVYMYNVVTKKIDQKEIPAFDISLGERGQVFFEGLEWKVIIGADQFLFYSEVTGEVFSDDNLSTSEAFRVKENLDTFLSQDKIEDLNFVINKAEE